MLTMLKANITAKIKHAYSVQIDSSFGSASKLNEGW